MRQPSAPHAADRALTSILLAEMLHGHAADRHLSDRQDKSTRIIPFGVAAARTLNRTHQAKAKCAKRALRPADPPKAEATPQDCAHERACVNRALAAARAPVERGVARLKSWRIFRRSRCSPNRMTSIAKAILTLERQR